MTDNKIVLWVSRHNMTEDQEFSIKDRYGEITIWHLLDSSQVQKLLDTFNVIAVYTSLPQSKVAEILKLLDPEEIPVLVAKGVKRRVLINGELQEQYLHSGWTRYYQIDIVSEEW